MSILSDRDIKALCENVETPMIHPFVSHQVKTRPINTLDPNGEQEKIVSYGLSSGGYDVTLDRQFKVFKNSKCQILDPLNLSDDYYDDIEADSCVIPPNGYILGITRETFNIPRDVIVVAVGKSTWARISCLVNVTPIEPGWRGRVVIEIANGSNVPVRVHAGMGISQFLFHRLSSPCEVSYGDRNGKYQLQNSITTAKV